MLSDDRLRGCTIRLAGHYQALVDRDDVGGLLEVSLRLVSLRQKRRRIHLSDDLSLLYEIALVHEYLRQPASDLGRHVDLGSLQSAIAAGETRPDRFGLEQEPNQSAGRRDHGQGDHGENDFAPLAYERALLRVGRLRVGRLRVGRLQVGSLRRVALRFMRRASVCDGRLVGLRHALSNAHLCSPFVLRLPAAAFSLPL